MTLSREPLRDDQLIRHLLGTLPEDEAQRVEEESIVDDEVAARLQVAEDDLVDAYARGTLGGDRLARFESFYLASPLRRDRVAFAKRFVAAVDSASAAGQEPFATVAAGWRGAAGWFPWTLAAAASLLLATGLLLARDVGLRRDMAAARERLAVAEQRVVAVAGQLADEQRASAVARRALEDARAAQPPAAIALLLMPQTRGIDPVPVVAVPAATALPLQLRVPAAGSAHYTAALRDPSTNGIVWRSPTVTAERGPRSSVVPVRIPGSLLKAQHYALDLFEVRAGTPEFVGSYAFEVARP